MPVAAPASAFNVDKMIDAVVESVKGYVHQLVIAGVGRQEAQMRDIGEQLRRIGGTGDVKAMEQRIDRLAARVAELKADAMSDEDVGSAMTRAARRSLQTRRGRCTRS